LKLLYNLVFYSPDKTQNIDTHLADTPQMNEQKSRILAMVEEVSRIPYEEVFIRSFDGLKLRGRYFHNRDSAPVLICFHGYRGTPLRDFSGGTRAYLDLGYNLLMAEQRAHCGSEGHTITFGVNERRDAHAWVRYAQDRFGADRPLALCGISMGAATVLLASGLGLPNAVRGIIADCPYTSASAIIKKVCRGAHLPARLLYPLIARSARVYGNFDVEEADVLAAAARCPVPVLLVHGEADHFVPCQMSRELAAANPSKITLMTFPGAGHGLSFLVDRPRYVAAVTDFLSSIFRNSPGSV
ncbi:MAG: alpha/beta hydrolase, partial [Lachnospiraceae bacterium]|nr:alpha/beta hydrolase [Lachnospiraceae bacterium]